MTDRRERGWAWVGGAAGMAVAANAHRKGEFQWKVGALAAAAYAMIGAYWLRRA